MKSRLKKLLFFVFPQLRFAKLSFDTIKSIYKFKKKRKKMQLPVKLAIGSLCALIFIVITGFIVFPKMIKGKVKKMTALLPQNDIRGMFVKVPFGLDFNIYMFNVTNPMEVNNGEMPILREIGPFCYEEWKTKESVEDMEGDDTMFYNATDTFLPKPGPGCLSGQEMVTMPHPLIMGMVNTLIRQKPGALTLANKAIKSIFENPASVFLTAKVTDVLFDSVTINCGVKDFAGKAVCSQLKAEPSFKRLSEDELGFSLLGAKNGTPSKRFKVYRGKNNPADLGRIVEFDEKPSMSVWPTDECNEIKGTDGTIFPTYLKKEDGLVSFAPDLCRSLAAQYEKKDEYMGIPVRAYSASLGDMSKNADEKCYCYTPETCLKKGLMDLYKCAGVPVYVSLPHFYDSDDSYLKGVKGLMPNKSAHEIIILFEPTTGSPVYAKKRLQFNMPMEPNEKVEIFNKLPNVVFPLFWVEEGVALNITYTKQLKDFFRITKSVAFAKWVILLAALGGLAASGYLFYKNNGKTEITPVHKVAPVDQIKNAISTMNGNGYNGEVNHGMDDHGEDKY